MLRRYPFLYKLADHVMSDEEYRDFLDYQIQHRERVTAEIGAVLEGAEKPTADSETLPIGVNQAFSENGDIGEVPSKESKL